MMGDFPEWVATPGPGAQLPAGAAGNLPKRRGRHGALKAQRMRSQSLAMGWTVATPSVKIKP
jgi:hypothetical protein